MNNLYCPYCDNDCGDFIDDCREPDVGYEHQCPNCDKNFTFTICYYPTFSSEKADCLNGGKHKWEKICGAPAEFFKDKYRCEMCDERKTLTDEEFTRLTGKLEGAESE